MKRVSSRAIDFVTNPIRTIGGDTVPTRSVSYPSNWCDGRTTETPDSSPRRFRNSSLYLLGVNDSFGEDPGHRIRGIKWPWPIDVVATTVPDDDDDTDEVPLDSHDVQDFHHHNHQSFGPDSDQSAAIILNIVVVWYHHRSLPSKYIPKSWDWQSPRVWRRCH